VEIARLAYHATNRGTVVLVLGWLIGVFNPGLVHELRHTSGEERQFLDAVLILKPEFLAAVTQGKGADMVGEELTLIGVYC
jgi:hypothetical protein